MEVSFDFRGGSPCRNLLNASRLIECGDKMSDFMTDHFRILLADKDGNPVVEVTPEGLSKLPKRT